MGGSMKVHQFARGLWDHESPSLTLGCKRLRPLVPKLQNTNSQNPTTTTTTHIAHLDLKSFIRPDSGPRNTGSPHQNKDPPQITAEAHPGGTRWNPTQEQIGILEMLYRGGMRTPNALQIEQITSQLSKYGKIEGKNVFYWFQNHKARERQKQKRNSLGLSHSPRTPSAPPLLLSTITLDKPRAAGVVVESTSTTRELEDSPYKRKYRSWGYECLVELESKSSSSSSSCCREEEEVDGDRTLELFPLHPEGLR